MTAHVRSGLIRAAVLILVVFSSACAGARSPRVFVAAFGLFSGQGVFLREASQAAQIVAERFGAAAALVRANTKTRTEATPGGIAGALQTLARSMDRQSDVLFVILTSHGSPEGLVVQTPRRTDILRPQQLAAILARTGVEHKVVVISACYAGVFLPVLANADTLVITAADADHTSFGCADEARWTYFGDAFFNRALRRAASVGGAFRSAQELVRARELAEGFTPSNPQLGGGSKVEPLLAGRR